MAYLNFLKRIFNGTGSDNTAEGAIIRAGGKHVSKTITLNANNTSASVNVFQVTGYNKCYDIHGEVLSVTLMSNCTNCYFDLWDGTTSVPITKTTGATLSGVGVGSGFVKDADVSSALTIIDNATCKMKEAAVGAKEGAPFTVTQKIATNTYIRFNYSTTNAPINAQLNVHMTFADIDSGTIVAV